MKIIIQTILIVLASAAVLYAQQVAPVFGSHRFVEYLPGDLPIVISVPHDGAAAPEIISDRTFGVTARDNGTQEIARVMVAEFEQRTGHSPSVIFSHLRRKKLDVNREEFEAAQDDVTALTAWNDYHGYIDSACTAAMKRYGACLLIDLHGQNHPEKRIEIGYRLENDDLALSDDALNSPEMIGKSSLRAIVRRSALTHAELVRGPKSFGALFDEHNVRSTPSPTQRTPCSYKYFSGGYTIYRHSVEDTSGVTAVQFELDPELRERKNSSTTAIFLTDVILKFMRIHYGREWSHNAQ
ncbi:MAG: hypothetical protein ACOYNS_02180 [Bacteroidota bacterium]